VSSKPDEALASLQSAEYAHRICQALVGRLTTTEAITGEQAVQIGPLPRRAKTTSPLVREWLPQEPARNREREEPLNKRPREELQGPGAAVGHQASLAGKKIFFFFKKFFINGTP
jgi:hypothetical protein